MIRARQFLALPTVYCRAIGGLRWGEAGDALERPDGATFVFVPELLAFLEGLAGERPLPSFGVCLHLLTLLREPRCQSSPLDFSRLQRAYRAAGRPLRTAGALCALLCAGEPAAPDPPRVADLRDCLAVWAAYPRLVEEVEPGLEPPSPPEAFEKRIARALSALTDRDLEHWLRHGRRPVGEAGEEVARSLLQDRPRTLSDVLADLTRRERLAGAVPFVDQLVSALALPPRRLSPRELPVGGYADVTTKGHPEQLLLSQFALDDVEFVRRFAEGELLYYRREEPHSRTREGLVVLLDQGVRTWGVVRLVLAAAVVALGRYAHKRRLEVRLALTGGSGELLSPLELSAEELGERVEASDLSPQPGLALERVLEAVADSGEQDVVLLTHPRNLAEPDVCAAARTAGPATRLFALTVDAKGSAELNELRHGYPVALGRFRIDLDRPAPAPRPRPERPRRPAAEAWVGDVEPVGFPFRFGLSGQRGPLLFTFDHSGAWLLTASLNGMLHLTRTDGTGYEVLPRPLVGGEVLLAPDAVLGVMGGFVVAGALCGQLVAAHYDLAGRTVRAHLLGPADAARPAPWRYLRARHTVAAGDLGDVVAVNLSTGEAGPISAIEHSLFPPGEVENCLSLCNREDWVGHEAKSWPWLCFDPGVGEISLRNVTPAWRPFIPRADGRPVLQNLRAVRASLRGSTLAVAFRDATGLRLYLFQGPDGAPEMAYLPAEAHPHFTMSADGRLLAFVRGPGQIAVHATGGPDYPPACVTPQGRFQNNVTVQLGERWLRLRFDRTVHLVRWDRGPLEHSRQHRNEPGWLADEALPGGTQSVWSLPGRCPGFLRYDPQRFRAAAWSNLIAAVDPYGQVFLFENTGDLVCAFFAFRQQFAAWLPDGTCLGAPALLCRPETPGAAEAVGRALSDAWERGERTVT
jgi:hypothetical protein